MNNKHCRQDVLIY